MGHLDLHGELTLRPPLKSDGVLVFQSQELNLESPEFNSFTPRHHGGGLNLYTGIGDIALRITVYKSQRKVHLNSRTAGENDSWGIDETAQLPPNAWSGPISICVCDQGDRYQVLVGLVTVHSFLKRIKTPWGIVKVGYSLPDPGPQWDPTLSRRLAVFVWRLSDLSDKVRKAIKDGLTEWSVSECGTDYSEVLVVEPKSQSAGASVIDSLPGCIVHLDLHGELILQLPLESYRVLIFQSQDLIPYTNVIESPKLNSFTPRYHGGGLNLYTKIGDIALRITINKAKREVQLNSRTSNQWGIDETAQLPPNAWGGPISIYIYDRGDRYQVMVGLVTVHSFLKRIKTPCGIVKVGYSLPDPGPQWDPTLSRRLAVSVCRFSDLSDRVRKAIEDGNLTEWSVSGCGTDYSEALVVEPKSQSAGASVIDSPPGCIGYVNHPLTMVSWENGKEIRMYYLDSKRILQEYAYSERKKKKCWYSGDLFRLKIVLSPDSVIAAVQLSDEIRIYYQEIGSGVIREVRKPPHTDSWIKDTTLSVAVKSSKIAVIGWINDGTHIRVYYQDPHFCLEEYCCANGHWTRGAFDPGPQLPGTPIFAEVSYIGYPAIQVLWKNSSGRFVSSCCDKYSQWDHPPAPEHGDPDEPNPSQLDGSG